MKTTTTYILTAIFILTSIAGFALTPKFFLKKNNFKKETPETVMFVKYIPAEAGFEEKDNKVMIMIDLNIPDFTYDVTPDLADLEDFINDVEDFTSAVVLKAVASPETPAEAEFEEVSEDFSALAPITPAEADFEEVTEPSADLTALAPVVPSEADFEEVPEKVNDLSYLSPVTPAEADFEDVTDTADLSACAPVAPAEANFDE